ncbi:unnamed protein product [Amoebophrya sp. A25]|nr:unnamed protein product [Amoebophrya sp. A25]|eukprot:GSA25T00027474001.1
MLKDIRDAVPGNPGNSGAYEDYKDSVVMDPWSGEGMWRNPGYELTHMAEQLAYEIDMHLVDPYYFYQSDKWSAFEKPISSKLARCTMRAIRENLPERKVMEIVGRMKRGEIDAAKVADRMLKPVLEKHPNCTSNVAEAKAFLHNNVTDLCARFCSDHKYWEEVSLPLQTGAAGKFNEPVWSEAEYPGAMMEDSCKVDNHCIIYNNLGGVAGKKETADMYANHYRLRERRQRRLKIEERRRRRALQEKEGSVAAETGEETKQRELAEYWEERGIDYIFPARDPLHRGSLRARAMTRKSSTHKRRINRRRKLLARR